MTRMLDGSPAIAWSPACCHQTEALAVLAMPTLAARRAHLEAVGRYRGKMARKDMEATVLRLWQARQPVVTG